MLVPSVTHLVWQNVLADPGHGFGQVRLSRPPVISVLLTWLGVLAALPALALQGPAAPVAVCVVSPRVEAVHEGDALGLVPTPRPQLVVIDPLLELRIERQGRLVWQQGGWRKVPCVQLPPAPTICVESCGLRLPPQAPSTP